MGTLQVVSDFVLWSLAPLEVDDSLLTGFVFVLCFGFRISDLSFNLQRPIWSPPAKLVDCFLTIPHIKSCHDNCRQLATTMATLVSNHSKKSTMRNCP